MTLGISFEFFELVSSNNMYIYVFISISILVQFRSFSGLRNVSLSVMLVVLLWLWWCNAEGYWITCVIFVYTTVYASQRECFSCEKVSTSL